MTANLTFLAAVVFCVRASAQCPADFLDAGELSASAGSGRYQETTVTRTLLLPQNIRIDTSYRQKSIQAAGDGAASDMRAAQIPAGIHLIPGGRTGGGWWSIANPKMELVNDRWSFQIDLYANNGSRPAPPANAPPVSDVRVRVCVKVVKPSDASRIQ